MSTTRRMNPASPLRMSQGGMFDSLKRAVGAGPKETMREKFAREDAALKVKMAASAPAPAAAPAPKAVSDYVGNSALQRREKAAGLRDGGDLRTGHGGHVPGKGKGDKVPAKYEPGEFVVSNDMLDAAPQLREQLHSLRGQVLAQKGMTPEQADAKALSGTGLRAQAGFDPLSRMAKDLTGQGSLPPRSPMGATAENLKRGPMGAQPQPGAATTRPTAPVSNAAGAMYDDSPEGRSSRQAFNQAFNQERAKAAGVGSKYDPASAKGPQAAVERPAAPTSAGPAKAPKMPGVRGKIAGAPGMVSRGATTTLRAAGTLLNNPVSRTLFGAGTGVALAGMTPTETAPGTLPQSVIDAMKKPFDPNMKPLDFTNPVPASEGPRGVPSPMSGTGSDGKRASGDFGYTPVGPTGRPNSPDFSKELASGELPQGLRRGVVHKTLDANGRTVYSGVGPTEAGGIVDKNGQNVRSGFGVTSLPGMPQAEINATLTNPDGSRWSARDNAIMAANLRDGVDPYRGTSRGQGPTNITLPDTGGVGLLSKEYQDARNLRMSGMPRRERRELQQQRANAELAAIRAAAEEQMSLRKDGTDRRGQDMDMQGKELDRESRERVATEPARAAREQAKVQAERRASYLRAPQGGSVDFAQAARAAAAAGDFDTAKDLAGMADDNDKRASTRQAALKDAVAADSTMLDDKGTPVVNDALKETNARMVQQLATARGVPVEDLLADSPSLGAALKLSKDINSRRDDNFLQMIGWDDADPTLESLGELRGAQLKDVGLMDAIFSGRQLGDKVLRTGNRDRYLSRDTVSDAQVQKMLKELGVSPK